MARGLKIRKTNKITTWRKFDGDAEKRSLPVLHNEDEELEQLRPASCFPRLAPHFGVSSEHPLDTTAALTFLHFLHHVLEKHEVGIIGVDAPFALLHLLDTCGHLNILQKGP